MTTKTLVLDLPEDLADELARTDRESIVQALQTGLQQCRQLPELTTAHPHIVRAPGKRGGRPIIRGTGVTVSLIARLYKAGDTVDEILESYPHLQASWVHDAIGYYLDHQDEIENEIRESRVPYLVERHGLMIDERGFVHFPEQSNSHGQ